MVPEHNLEKIGHKLEITTSLEIIKVTSECFKINEACPSGKKIPVYLKHGSSWLLLNKEMPEKRTFIFQSLL